MYGIDQSGVNLEAQLAKKILSTKDVQSVCDVAISLRPLQEAFLLLTKVIEIAMTIDVLTAECERSFSALKRIKTHLRTTMHEERLTDLAVLSIERELNC